MKKWIWQHQEYPHFKYDKESLVGEPPPQPVKSPDANIVDPINIAKICFFICQSLIFFYA